MVKFKELEYLSILARIKLTEKDKESLIKEFDSILGYIDRLKSVNITDDVSARVGAVRNVMREDGVQSVPDETREAILKEAPYREGDFVAVKKIIAQDIKL